MQSDLEEYIRKSNERLIEQYASDTLDQLKDKLAKAREKYDRAVLNYQRHYLASDKVHIEDASVRIENLKFVISEREKHQSLKDAVDNLEENNWVIPNKSGEQS
jgi:transcriptional regulator of heat shock response